MKPLFFTSLFAVICTLLFNPTFAKELHMAGSTTVQENVITPHKNKIEQQTGLSLKTQPNGSSRGLLALSRGLVDVAMISAPLETMLNKINIPPTEHALYKAHPVGFTEVVFAVHKQSPLNTLTKEDMTQILKGEITNWAHFNTPEIPITIFIEYAGGGYRTMVEKDLLNGEAIRGKVKSLENAYRILEMEKLHEIGLYVMTQKIFNQTQNLKQLQTDFTIKQPMFFITKGDIDANTQKLIHATQQLHN